MTETDLPRGWRMVRLDSVASVQTGLAKGKQGVRDPLTLPYLRVANVRDGFLDLADIKEIQVERTEVERYRLQEGDVLLTEGGDNDKWGAEMSGEVRFRCVSTRIISSSCARSGRFWIPTFSRPWRKLLRQAVFPALFKAEHQPGNYQLDAA